MTLRPIPVLLALVLAFASAGFTAPARAADPPLPAWEQLTPNQREQLIAPVRERWNAQPEQRARMLNHAQRWREMTPEQRRDARKGQRRWENMDPAQREQMRALYQRLRALPPAEQEELRARFRAMTPQQRREWIRQNAPARE